jgi:hypothetical protein
VAEYDRIDEIPLGSKVQLRRGIATRRGGVPRFFAQLEYRLGDEWAEVVRFDHDEDAEGGHDVTEEGVHMDVYRDGEKVDTEYVAGPMPADEALDLAEDHLTEELERLIRRFEQWHNLNPNRENDR